MAIESRNWKISGEARKAQVSDLKGDRRLYYVIVSAVMGRGIQDARRAERRGLAHCRLAINICGKKSKCMMCGYCPMATTFQAGY